MRFQITEEKFAEEIHDWLRTVFGGSIVEVKTEYGKAYIIDETEYRILREGFLKREFGDNKEKKPSCTRGRFCIRSD